MKLLLWISIFFSLSALASSEFTRLFNELYYNEYRAQRCGENIRDLLTHADAKSLDITDAEVLVIRNKGLTVFGQVNALYARTPSLQYSANERNWRFHVILMKGNFIYDFDFGNQPTVSSVGQYFQKMFFNSEARSRFKVDPEQKKDDYIIEFYNPIKYLRGEERIRKSISLREFLKNK